MDLHELEYISAIAHYGSLTSAAKELYVSQPTLSKCLQKVETDLGIALFEHAGRKMIPTYAGERYIAHAEMILAQKDKMDAEMKDILHSDSGVLRVGMPPFRCAYSLEEILPVFSKKYPGVLFKLYEESSANLDKMLKRGEIDLAFFMSFRQDEELSYKVIRNDKPYIIFAKGHALEKKARKNGFVRLKDLSNQDFIIQSSSQRLGQYVLRTLAANNVTPGSIMKNTNLRASCALAASGYGVAFAYGEMLQFMNLPTEYCIYPVAEFDMNIDFTAAWRSTSVLSEYAEYFIKLVEETSKF